MPGLQAGDPPSGPCRRREAAEQSAASFYYGKSASRLALFLICAFCSFAGSAALLEESKAARLCLLPPGEAQLSSVVRVITGAGAHASGVVVAQDRVITALHVVAGAEYILSEVRGFSWPAQVAVVDTENDLVLLEVRTFNLEPLALSSGAPREAEVLWSVGFPLAGKKRVAAGRLLSQAGARLKSSATVAAGSSGGALVRCVGQRFELTGMITGYAPGKEPFALAVPAARITRLLRAQDGQ